MVYRELNAVTKTSKNGKDYHVLEIYYVDTDAKAMVKDYICSLFISPEQYALIGYFEGKIREYISDDGKGE